MVLPNAPTSSEHLYNLYNFQKVVNDFFALKIGENDPIRDLKYNFKF